jgi:hypothetical protein
MPSWIRIRIRIQQLKLMRIHADPEFRIHNPGFRLIWVLTNPSPDSWDKQALPATQRENRESTESESQITMIIKNRDT